MFTRTSILVAALVGVVQLSQAVAQPMPAPVVVQEVAIRVPQAPPAMIGITVSPVTVKIGNGAPFAGARVVTDVKGRALWQPNGRGGHNQFKFNPGGDVIHNVNGVGVANAGDISANIVKGWNKISTYDTSNGTWGTYDIYCD